MKKVSWWDSKYSDFTHKEENLEYVTLYLKGGKNPSKCRTVGFVEYAEGSGRVLKLVEVCGKRHVVLSSSAFEALVEATKAGDYESSGRLTFNPMG